MLENLALIAEIIGAAAVIVTIAFVGFELRDNTKATKSSMASATVDAISTWYGELGGNDQSSTLFLHFMQNPDGLSNEERFQATMKVHAVSVIMQNAYYMKLKGTLDEEIFSHVAGALYNVRNQPGWAWYWEHRKGMFFKEFRDYIDNLSIEGEPKAQSIYELPELSASEEK